MAILDRLGDVLQFIARKTGAVEWNRITSFHSCFTSILVLAPGRTHSGSALEEPASVVLQTMSPFLLSWLLGLRYFKKADITNLASPVITIAPF
jgi:hypothetical protein